MVENITPEPVRNPTSGVKSCHANKKGGKCFITGSIAAIMFQLTFNLKHLRQVTFALGGLSLMKFEEAPIVRGQQCGVGAAKGEQCWR